MFLKLHVGFISVCRRGICFARKPQMEFTGPADQYRQGYSTWYDAVPYFPLLLRPEQGKVGNQSVEINHYLCWKAHIRANLGLLMDLVKEINSGSTLSTLPRHRAGASPGYLWDWVSSSPSAPCSSPFRRGTQMVSALKALSKTAKWAQFIIFGCFFSFLALSQLPCRKV